MLLLFQIFRSKFILKSLIAIGLVIKEKSNLLIHKNLRMLLIFIYLKLKYIKFIFELEIVIELLSITLLISCQLQDSNLDFTKCIEMRKKHI